MTKELLSESGLGVFRSIILIAATIVAGCATPTEAPCSNWSAICGCYCGTGGTWSGAEPQAQGEALKRITPLRSQADKDLSASDKAAIHTVYIDLEVILPRTPLVRTRGDTWAEGFGGLVAVFRSLDQSKEQATVEYLEKNNIHIGNMLFEAFTTELEARHQFSVSQSPIGADAVIRLAVLTYGVEHTFNPLSNDYRTLLKARATMLGSEGKINWIKEISAESDDESLATFKELYGDPEIMRKHMFIVAKICAKKMVDHLVRAR